MYLQIIVTLRYLIPTYGRLISIFFPVKVLNKDEVSRPLILYKNSLSNTLQSKADDIASPHEVLQLWKFCEQTRENLHRLDAQIIIT